MTPIVAVSLKMYFDRARTLDYCRAVAEIARKSAAVQGGAVRLAVLPDHLTLAAAARVRWSGRTARRTAPPCTAADFRAISATARQ